MLLRDIQAVETWSVPLRRCWGSGSASVRLRHGLGRLWKNGWATDYRKTTKRSLTDTVMPSCLGIFLFRILRGGDSLLRFMQEEQRYFQAAFQDVHDVPESLLSVWERIVPWAYHDWNGDVCLLVPESAGEYWRVAVAFRQNPGFLLIDGGVAEFLKELKQGKLPGGWPVREPWWQSMPDSPLI